MSHDKPSYGPCMDRRPTHMVSLESCQGWMQYAGVLERKVYCAVPAFVSPISITTTGCAGSLPPAKSIMSLELPLNVAACPAVVIIATPMSAAATAARVANRSVLQSGPPAAAKNSA